jgi:hypothetical protein
MMRIAQISPFTESIPPKLYGGTERVVAWLVDELLEAAWPRALRLGQPRCDSMAAQTALLEALSRRANDFDVIHAHIDWLRLPLLSRHGTQVRLIGEVNDGTKEKFLGGAAALSFPIDLPEPFGLVMIEAMACGTPVLAFRSGSVPEVVDEAISGFIVEGRSRSYHRSPW